MNNRQIGILLGGMCCLLSIGICVQVRTVSSTSSTFGRTQTENELRDSVSRWQEKYKNAYNKLAVKETELENLRTQASNNNANSSNLSETLKAYNTLLGYSEIKGPGIVITLKDGDASINKAFISDSLVHDGDILEVINALKNAEAEAISVNGQRIVNSSEITCIGNVIKINGEKVGAPFVINAIGLPLRLYSSLTMNGGYLSQLQDAGVQVDVKQVEKNTIVIPKYEGVYKYEYARRAE